MDLKSTIQNDLKTSLKAQDSLRLNTIRMLVAEIKKREIDKRSALTDEEIQKTASTLVKQRQESIEAFEKGGRKDLADKEREEIIFLRQYLPQQLSVEAVRKIVLETIAELHVSSPNDLGKVMKGVLAKTKGQAEGKIVNELVQKELSSLKA